MIKIFKKLFESIIQCGSVFRALLFLKNLNFNIIFKK